MYKLVVPSSSDVELYSSHQLFHAATQLYSHYTQIIWPIILCEDVLSAIKFLYNLNYTIILLYSAPNVLYEALADSQPLETPCNGCQHGNNCNEVLGRQGQAFSPSGSAPSQDF